jgi:hypothetical protein
MKRNREHLKINWWVNYLFLDLNHVKKLTQVKVHLNKLHHKINKKIILLAHTIEFTLEMITLLKL